jgi:hypothetical protein
VSSFPESRDKPSFSSADSIRTRCPKDHVSRDGAGGDPDLFESLSIRGDPVGFRMIANEFAVNAATIQLGPGLLQKYIIPQKRTLPDNIVSLAPGQLMKY